MTKIYYNFVSRCEENACLLNNDEFFPVLPSMEEVSTAAENEDDGLDRKEELGICQVLERLEEITNMQISR